MRQSQLFRKLERRIVALRKSYIPVAQPFGNYKKKELDDTRAFVLMTHAEIETFLEETAKITLNRIFNTFVKKKKDSHTLMHFVGAARDIKPITLSFSSTRTLLTYLHEVRLQYENNLLSNNGLKEANLVRIFIPLGIRLDTTFVTELDSFGAIRGEIAHNSFTTYSMPNPQDYVRRVQLILNELSLLDRECLSLK